MILRHDALTSVQGRYVHDSFAILWTEWLLKNAKYNVCFGLCFDDNGDND